ncbi:uncharacterized protein LOC114525474 [Dendronephthya gigantea]|uniref:uncharacterized protein LOC114525474 n=1 Tax=Dendronephthya gigantea TaxID=151771 RepID=UPI00106CD19E|nr:uncharacterized protein LOC114525474 [Dendronephthya gigantea]
MSCQWNALNVNVIKTRKIECAKLQLPATLAKSSRNSAATPKLAPTSKEKLNSSSEKSNEALRQNHSSIIDSIIPLLSTDESLNSSAYTEDEVFQESFETPPEKDSIFSENATKRCLSLPSYLTFEEYSYSRESGARFAPRRLFEEALNLESYSGRLPATRVDSEEFSEDFTDHIFPRLQEHILKRNASGTGHAGQMKKSKSSSQINCDDNNNVRYDQNHLQSTDINFATQSKEKFDVRDWEQKVLVLTSDYEFGTEYSKKPRDEIDARSRSVALTENISTFASDKICKDQTSQRQVKSETHSEMPKLQTVVWDYIKRRSTKKKRKNDNSRLEQNDNLKGENLKATNQESSSGPDRRKSKDESSPKVKNVQGESVLKSDRNNAGSSTPGISRKSRAIRSWKSDPNLNSNRRSGNIKLRRYNSHNILSSCSDKFPPKLPKMERQMNSKTLTFLLTTAPEEKSIEERMMTLKMSREWLLKELKSMREQDRKLARQFIHLRSAIVEMKEYCEKEDSEYESECEAGTQDIHKNHKRSEISKERKIPIHNTPTINILSYC